MPKQRRKKPRECFFCKSTWSTYTWRDRMREKRASTMQICPPCWASYGWKPIFDASAGGQLPINLRKFEIAQPHKEAPLPTSAKVQPIKGGRVRRANYLETLKILSDGTPHILAELAPAGEKAITTLGRLRRMRVAGTIRKTASGWMLNNQGEAAPPRVTPEKQPAGRSSSRPGVKFTTGVLSDDRAHTFAELAAPGEARKATESRLRRLRRGGKIIKNGKTWQIVTQTAAYTQIDSRRGKDNGILAINFWP